MKKENHENLSDSNIPELDIIDLDDMEQADFSEEADFSSAEEPFSEDSLEEEREPERKHTTETKKKRHLPFFNMHIAVLVVFIIFVCGIVYKIKNFGQYVDLNEIFKDGQGTYEDTLDEIIPLQGADGNWVTQDYSDGVTIVAFGNSPFADDRDSKDGLANIIAESTHNTVYNCSIGSSFLAAEFPYLSIEDKPRDIFTFYWMCQVVTNDSFRNTYLDVLDYLGDRAPADAKEAFDTLCSIDFNEVDVVAVCYDASDYLVGHPMYSDENSTDIEQFTGNLEAGIELLQSAYPNIRIIVMSPPYAFSNELDENGNYISSDIQRYGQDVLSTYVIKEYTSCVSRSVSFVDNLYGTITEENAKDYLVDNLHLNAAGRKLMAERFIYALYYYNQDQLK